MQFEANRKEFKAARYRLSTGPFTSLIHETESVKHLDFARVRDEYNRRRCNNGTNVFWHVDAEFIGPDGRNWGWHRVVSVTVIAFKDSTDNTTEVVRDMLCRLEETGGLSGHTAFDGRFFYPAITIGSNLANPDPRP